MNRSLRAAFALVLGLPCAPAGTTMAGQTAGNTYAVLSEHSTVGFGIVKWMVLRESGRFTRLTGAIRYDPGRAADSSVAIEVHADSLDTGIAMRDSVLRSDDFFDVERFPTLSFRSVAVRAEGPAALQVTGDLTIRGVTQRIAIPVVVLGVTPVHGTGTMADFESRFTIDRTAFGVNGTRWSGGRLSLSREVEIELRIAAKAPEGE